MVADQLPAWPHRVDSSVTDGVETRKWLGLTWRVLRNKTNRHHALRARLSAWPPLRELQNGQVLMPCVQSAPQVMNKASNVIEK